MDEFVPTFEDNLVVQEEKQEESLLVQIDLLEDKIRIIDEYSKKYKDLKEKIKEQMLVIGRETNATQVKWITPKGIKMTCSIGKAPIYETKEVEEFNMIKFMEEQPKIYEKYLEKKTRNVVVQNGSSDRLTITLPKEKQDDND